MPKIYIVEDDDNIRDLVLYAMKNVDFTVQGFSGSKDFYKAVEESLPDLVLLDIMLPNEDGLSILNRLKSGGKTKQLPIIMLTAKSSEYDRVKGLDLGADDYITKPFSVLELISRIRAVLRRTEQKDSKAELFTCDNVELNPQKHTVKVDNEIVVLTYKEFELLQFLMGNADLVLSRDRIMSAVWGTDFEYETRTVDMHIKTLRKKLGTGGEIIKTVRGVGYKVGKE
jgi:Response regulators consisting of a CheY-like receiver domain and a winged-helix DNA-binding domain